jgi:hypothetical protein
MSNKLLQITSHTKVEMLEGQQMDTIIVYIWWIIASTFLSLPILQ